VTIRLPLLRPVQTSEVAVVAAADKELDDVVATGAKHVGPPQTVAAAAEAQDEAAVHVQSNTQDKAAQGQGRVHADIHKHLHTAAVDIPPGTPEAAAVIAGEQQDSAYESVQKDSDIHSSSEGHTDSPMANAIAIADANVAASVSIAENANVIGGNDGIGPDAGPDVDGTCFDLERVVEIVVAVPHSTQHHCWHREKEQ